MNPGAMLIASLLATLARPSTWVLSLVAFLVRGGLILVLAPIVVVPSVVGLANVFAPAVTDMAFGGMTDRVAGMVGLAVAAVAAWVVLGGWLAGSTEAEAVRRVAADEELTEIRGGRPVTVPSRRHVAPRILVARLIAAGPLVLALGFGSYRIVMVAYRELTVPSEVAVPVALRVIRGSPEAVVAVILAWALAEVVGALAARRIVLTGDGVAGALLGAVGHLVRHPLRSAAAFIVPGFGLVGALVPSAAAAVVSWDLVRAALVEGAEPLVSGALVLGFVALWCGGLVLIGMATAWRGAAWTVELAGTFGGVTQRRPGEWNLVPDSGTLGDLRPRGADPEPR